MDTAASIRLVVFACRPRCTLASHSAHLHLGLRNIFPSFLAVSLGLFTKTQRNNLVHVVSDPMLPCRIVAIGILAS